MQNRILLAFVIFTLLNNVSAITHSLPTFHGEFPWHAAIYRMEQKQQYICAGSLLNEKTVLTLARCVFSTTDIISQDKLIVSLGQYDLDKMTNDSQQSRVEQVIPHELYNMNFHENDIAILILKSMMEYSNFIKPISITNDASFFDSNVGVVPGWGFNENGTIENSLKKGAVPIISNNECRAANNLFSSFLNNNNFCAGYQNGTSVCIGDSGGGLVIDQNGQPYIRGIVSFGLSKPNYHSCDSSQPAVFTDVVKFYGWIMDKVHIK